MTSEPIIRGCGYQRWWEFIERLLEAVSCRSRQHIRDIEPAEIREQLIDGSKKSDLLKQRLEPPGQ